MTLQHHKIERSNLFVPIVYLNGDKLLIDVPAPVSGEKSTGLALVLGLIESS